MDVGIVILPIIAIVFALNCLDSNFRNMIVNIIKEID